MLKRKTGYEPEIVVAFLDASGIRRDDGRFDTINEVRLEFSAKAMIQRWEALESPALVPLDRIDVLLMRQGLMLCELDHWAIEHYGRSGWADPYAEPEDLAA